MAKLAFHVVIKAAPGQTEAVEGFLHWAEPRIKEEPGTKTWYALRSDEGTYEIFDTFDDEDSRQAHWFGKVGDALRAETEKGIIFAEAPQVTKLAVLASKVTSD